MPTCPPLAGRAFSAVAREKRSDQNQLYLPARAADGISLEQCLLVLFAFMAFLQRPVDFRYQVQQLSRVAFLRRQFAQGTPVIGMIRVVHSASWERSEMVYVWLHSTFPSEVQLGMCKTEAANPLLLLELGFCCIRDSGKSVWRIYSEIVPGVVAESLQTECPELER